MNKWFFFNWIETIAWWKVISAHPVSTSGGMKTGVILLLPSEVRVSIWVLVRGLAGEEVGGGTVGVVMGDGTVFAGGTLSSALDSRLLVATKLGFSRTTADAGWLLANDFP